MKRWIRRRLGLAVLLLTAPVVLWLLIVALVPTGWARDLLVEALERETGRSIRLAGVQIGPLGGVHLRGLEVAQPGNPDDPWLTAERISIDVSPAELLAGRVEPGRVEARGVFVRLRRDTHGRFEIADLLRRGPVEADEDPDRDSRREDERDVAFSLLDARVVVHDEPTGARMLFTDLEGQGTWRRHRTTLSSLHGRLNGGPFLLEAEIERGLGQPMFEGELHAREVGLGQEMPLLHYVVPILSDSAVGLSGRLDLNLYLRGQGDSAEALRRSLVGRGAVKVDPITLQESHLLAELGRVLTLPDGARVGSVSGTFEVGQGRVGSRNLTLEVGALPVILDGWTDFDGKIDYRVRAHGLAHAITAELRSALEDLPLAVDDLMELRLRGNAGHPELTFDGLPIGRGPDGRPLSDKERLRQVARRLRDRLLR